MFYSSDHCRTSRYLLPAVFKHPSLQANVITLEIVGHSIKMFKEKFTYTISNQTKKNPTSGNYAKLRLDDFFSAKIERRSSSGPMDLCNIYFPTESTCRQTVYRVKLTNIDAVDEDWQALKLCIGVATLKTWNSFYPKIFCTIWRQMSHHLRWYLYIHDILI